ncbi:hypothetical protein HYALB_00007503 [Hymenoscyphus albidus]|uniref:Mid2 domain-containing protein n=1 Tax=Hymenoscyphus albidus TaxID=595503 RepID=A0A9N9QCH5_9HELO|nr:hypothetical protein HYALB_00007503 [Hymenoscyphus albidus]
MSSIIRRLCFASPLYPLFSMSPKGALGQPLSTSGKFPVADGRPLMGALAPRETIALATDSIASAVFTPALKSNIPTSTASLPTPNGASNTSSPIAPSSTNEFAGFQPVATSTLVPFQPATPQRVGISTGAKAGIAIGICLGVAVLIAVASWLCLKKRRSLAKRSSVDSEMIDLKGGDSTRHERKAPHGQEMDDKEDDYTMRGPYDKLP